MSDMAAAAVDALYGAAFSAFTAERKRLSDERKAAGDKAGAREMLALKKPTMSAWVVNQLHRRAPDELAALFDAGAKLRKGDFTASAAQKAALATLRRHAAEILTSDGHAAAEGTLQRVQQTLQALSAIGSWAPDPPGALVADRDPPGFDALSGVAPSEIRAATPAKPKEPTAEEKRRAVEREAELEKLEAAAIQAREEVEACVADITSLREAMEQAETALTEARAAAAEAERMLERARRRA
jgi:hypothetical protein